MKQHGMKKRTIELCSPRSLVLVTITLITVLWSGQALARSDPIIKFSPPEFLLVVFVCCVAIGIVTQIAGTGGGVIFTTLTLGFTRIHPDIVRATGLLAAMCGTRISARRFLRKGLANIKVVLLVSVSYTIFAVIGAMVGLEITKNLGDYGIAIIKLLLGMIVVAVGVLYLTVGKVEYPEVKETDDFAKLLDLKFSFWEESLQSVVTYQVRRVWPGVLLFCGVGFISGMFGLGAGWAVSPVLNLGMSIPLKVATASSVTVISIGDTAAIFPYLESNSLIPIFAVPATVGLMVGAEMGSRIAVWVKPKIVRYILIAILFFAGIKLIIIGTSSLGVF